LGFLRSDYLMKKIASSIEYPENVIEDAKYSVSYFEPIVS